VSVSASRSRALVRDPTVFLLDEPLSNLDAKLRASAREELTSFHKRVRTTTIYVTHDQVEAMAMGNRIVVLDKGVVRQIGTPSEVYDEPADTFVATFLGSPPMNMLEDSDFIAGFRPESVVPSEMIHGPSAPVRLRITLVEYLGAERILHGVVEGGRFHGRKVVSRVATAASGGLGEGAVHDFAVPAREVKFFDRATGKRGAARELSWR
jgi:multiple sugar transport system ATP-binding protein